MARLREGSSATPVTLSLSKAQWIFGPSDRLTALLKMKPRQPVEVALDRPGGGAATAGASGTARRDQLLGAQEN
jgi:hypothetical protein